MTLKLEESYTSIHEVVITAKAEKDKALNELATISARQFNTEEVSRYFTDSALPTSRAVMSTIWIMRS